MAKYNYKNCQSLFGYSADIHIRCKGRCQLCGCGGVPLNFDLWRQMTVEHLIGKSQGGYLSQLRELVDKYFSELHDSKRENLARNIDKINTVTACQFCNSTTSRDVHSISMYELFEKLHSNREMLVDGVREACASILKKKQQSVEWKLEAVREAYESQVLDKILDS